MSDILQPTEPTEDDLIDYSINTTAPDTIRLV